MIGLFGGTFDPFHFGHLNLAIELKEKAGLSEVWFIPARTSPFPKEGPPLSPKDRLKMIELGIDQIPGFSFLPLELEREGPSYTIDTLRVVKELYPNKSFALLLGEDAALEFYRWKCADEIVALVPLLIGCRRGINLLSMIETLPTSNFIKDILRKGMVQTRFLDIDARDIRKRLRERLYLGHLVPANVLDFIYENQLYFTH